MLKPKWHILFGAAFAVLIWIAAPKTSPLYILFVFLSAIVIDFDHYLCFVLKTKQLGVFHSFEYHKQMEKEDKKSRKKGIKQKGDFHIFHTIEFHVLIGLLGLWWIGFFYIFLGMIFHSLLDIYALLFIRKAIYQREFFLAAWIWKRFK